jgi:transposase
MLAGRGIKTVIPQKSNEIAARQRKGSAGGWAPALDAEIYKGRNVVERSFNLSKQWRGLATRHDWPSPTGPQPSSTPASAGFAYWETRPRKEPAFWRR